MDQIEMAEKLVVIAGIMIAVFFDWKARRIPNWLTFSLLVIGLLFHTWAHGWAGFGQSAAGFAAGIFFLFIPFAFGGVGGGDVKLMGAIGSLVGAGLVFKIFLATAIFGGIFSLLEMIQRKAVRKTLKRIRDLLVYVALTKRIPPEETAKAQGLHIPYAFAIGCGTLFVLCVMGGG